MNNGYQIDQWTLAQQQSRKYDDDILRMRLEKAEAEIARLRAELDALKPKPVKHVMYVNIYPGSPAICAGNATRKDADLFAGATRIACVRVEFTEGQYDD